MSAQYLIAIMDKANETGKGDLVNDKSIAPSEVTTVDFDQPNTLVGRCLDGRFFIEKNLTDDGGDAGGIGVVYLAKDTKLMGKDVVVKILNETALKHPDIVRKFEHEKEALIRLDHPGIVRILDSGTLTDGNPFMVMDYIRGHSLRKALQMAGRLPLEVAAAIIESVTDALSAAHSAKILHRDIKPENIMLTPLEEGLYRVRLIDFGIARVEDSKLAPATEISRAIGSVLYIAPEQLIGRLDLTPAADIFATAIVAYEMLTGEVPFKPNAIAEMYQMERDGVQTRPTALRPDMPREAERILLSALEFEPEKRPQNARAFGRYLAHELRIDSLETDRFYASVRTEFSKSPTQVMPMPDLTDFPTVRHVETIPIVVGKFSRFIKWAVPTVIVLALVSISGGYLAWNAIMSAPGTDPPGANTVPIDLGVERELSYFLMVQKMRNGKAFEEPYKSSGQETVESGYRVTLFFQSDADGYFYVFNEGKDERGDTGFRILFPTPKRNDGSSRVAARQPVETAGGTLDGGRGTEIIWMIWSKDRRDDLEAVVRAAFITAGVIDNTHRPLLQNYLEKYQESKPEPPTKDTDNQRMVLKARGGTVVHRFELEHR